MSQEQNSRARQQEVTVDEQEAIQAPQITPNKQDEAPVSAATESSTKDGDVYIDVPVAAGKKRKKRKFRERLVYESEISPKPSIWPIALAFAIAMLLFGLIYNVYFLVIGVILTIVCVMGWVLERQKA